MSTLASKSQQRSSISPFPSRRSSTAASSTGPKSAGGRPTTPSSSSSSRASHPPSKLSVPPPPPQPAAVGSSPTASSSTPTSSDRHEFTKPKESVTVTVRFRPLSAREINKGDELAWYADGDYTVRNEFNAAIAYGFDRVFGPATTTRHVYDFAAQHVVSGAMQGINGTVFAYGVTSSGKTHTMHGEQKSPGIIPLAIKDVFGLIQEACDREFLLRVSYLEIYNEVINDLLDPAGQNLRIREDAQGTYVEGIKEEVVLSPAHALSLIASGEEHRHVGSNNFNLLSSRSHTIFSLTIESSPRGENQEEDVTLSQLNLIDLAGSESSKTETTGLRRKEGSYINKSLLTLGTVIAKLTDNKATHIPYRDSKLTRLLQSSLSGHGRVSLICTVTPASSNSEETHNTLKFAHRSKHVEIKASQNKIMDEKSLIKKYQREILSLKQELQQLKHGMIENPCLVASGQDDLANLKLQLEAGQVKLQSRLEEEEQAKAALMGRIQRLTKLILVSTKNSIPSSNPGKGGHRRRHSFGEDELAYLPDRKREYIDDDAGSLDSEVSSEGRCDTISDESIKFDKKNRKRGMLGWFKLRKPEGLSVLSAGTDSESSASGSPASCSRSSQQRHLASGIKDAQRKSISKRNEEHPQIVDSFSERTQAGDLFGVTARGCRLPPTGTTITDQMDLLREQVKMLAGEIALCTSSLKRLSERASRNPEDSHIQEQMRKLKDEISEKKLQIRVLEKRMFGSIGAPQHSLNNAELSQALSKLASQLNEKTFELEIMAADNRVLQEQLQMKISENTEIQETVLLLRQQLSSILDKSSNNSTEAVGCESCRLRNHFVVSAGEKEVLDGSSIEMHINGSTSYSAISLPGRFPQQECKGCKDNLSLNSQVLMQGAEIENLKQEKVSLIEEKEGLVIHSQKLAEEALYAKELAAAAAVELKNLAEEVTKLSFQNAKLTGDLAAAKESFLGRPNGSQRHAPFDVKQDFSNNVILDCLRRKEDEISTDKLQKELMIRSQREASLEAALSVRDQRETELQKRIDEAKHREEDLENELANMWVLVAKMKKTGMPIEENTSGGASVREFQLRNQNGFHSSKANGVLGLREEEKYVSSCTDGMNTVEMRAAYESERRKSKELESIISRLKSEDLRNLDMAALEELQSLHVEAITRICQAKVILLFITES
ncbi:Kinesin-like protein NACK2 [Acorus calamus]|uniref:Kinesin-like protein NACK2 n=2 Tax=Magnoliopsida TaxID=3398 RepID=A0AAV9EEL4_ACOCL|nr:Kinesin-like protein NACK2 [Acorus calamus]